MQSAKFENNSDGKDPIDRNCWLPSDQESRAQQRKRHFVLVHELRAIGRGSRPLLNSRWWTQLRDQDFHALTRNWITVTHNAKRMWNQDNTDTYHAKYRRVRLPAVEFTANIEIPNMVTREIRICIRNTSHVFYIMREIKDYIVCDTSHAEM